MKTEITAQDLRLVSEKPPMVKSISKNIYGNIGVYHWQCPNTLYNGLNKWKTRQTSAYVTIRCEHCKQVVSLSKY